MTNAPAAPKRTRAIAAVVAAGASLALASTASAQETSLSGETSDGVAIKLTVGEFGNATSFRVNGNDVECKHGTLSNGIAIYSPLKLSDPGSFRDKKKIDTCKVNATWDAA